MGIIVACKQKAVVAPVDLNAEKTAITEVLDKQYTLMHDKKVAEYMAFQTEDALTLGTDPKEFWTKTQMTEAFNQMAGDTSVKFDYKPEKRDIRVSADGNHAIVVEQMFINFISPKVQGRRIVHLVKTGGSWMIDFDAVSMVPNNEDIGKINKALE